MSLFTTLFPLFLLVALLVVGVPVAYTMFLAGTIGLILILGVDATFASVQSAIYNSAVSFLFAAVPMFVLMATFMEESKVTEDLFNVANQWTSNFPAGLPIATTIANGGMAVLSGSSTASAAAMSRIAVPEMRQRGYNLRLAMGTVSASGTFASMLPPSLALIIYGLITQESIAALFIGGIIPGLLTIVGYAIVIGVWVHYRPPDPDSYEQRSYSWREKLSGLRTIWGGLLLVVIVLGGLYTGVITPAEAGGIGAAGALLIGIINGMRGSEINDALESAAEITAMIFMIFIGAIVFSQYLSATRTTHLIVDFVTDLPLSAWGILIVILLLYIALGAMMDQIAALLMTLPITYPLIVTTLGFDAIWFGILLIKTVEIGLVTPPFGLNVYVASGAIDVDTYESFQGAIRFLIADVVVLILMLAFPQTVLWLPGLIN